MDFVKRINRLPWKRTFFSAYGVRAKRDETGKINFPTLCILFSPSHNVRNGAGAMGSPRGQRRGNFPRRANLSPQMWGRGGGIANDAHGLRAWRERQARPWRARSEAENETRPRRVEYCEAVTVARRSQKPDRGGRALALSPAKRAVLYSLHVKVVSNPYM